VVLLPVDLLLVALVVLLQAALHLTVAPVVLLQAALHLTVAVAPVMFFFPVALHISVAPMVLLPAALHLTEFQTAPHRDRYHKAAL